MELNNSRCAHTTERSTILQTHATMMRVILLLLANVVCTFLLPEVVELDAPQNGNLVVSLTRCRGQSRHNFPLFF